MAARTARTKSAPVAEVEEVETPAAEPTFKQIANDAIDEAGDQIGGITAANRYKVQRAFGFIAIQLAHEAGELDELIAEVVAHHGDLPAGFGLERSIAEKPAPKAKAAAPAKPAARKAAAKPAAKASARKRPTR